MGRAAMKVTQQYLAGELSLLLARLQAVATNPGPGRDLAALRRQAETSPVTELGSVAARALRCGDALCWDSVSRGDLAAFGRQAEVSAELYEFSMCARLLDAE